MELVPRPVELRRGGMALGEGKSPETIVATFKRYSWFSVYPFCDVG